MEMTKTQDLEGTVYAADAGMRLHSVGRGGSCSQAGTKSGGETRAQLHD